jgi:hypothetical protein
MILNLNVFNGQKSSKFAIMVKNNNYTFDDNLGPHAKKYSFYYNMSHVWFQY